MRSVMPGLVGESQSAFVKGRKIHDGALIACKTVHRLKRQRKAAAIIKLDFHKAYDRVKWCFFYTVLEKMGFGMDVLNRMIGEAVRNGRISPLLVGRDDIELSHLQFADDTILLCPPEEGIVRSYKRLLRCFEVMSGLSINFEKSSLIPVNYSQEWTSRMCQMLGCQEATLPVRYLVISLGANPRLPVYYLSLYKMPNVVARRIISLQRRFFWGKDDGRPGMALVKWEVIQAPKKLEGLGVGDVVVHNIALLFKWWWRFSKEDCPLWKKIILQEATMDEEILRYRFTKEIWRGLVLPRVELFSWFALIGLINTKDRLSRLDILGPPNNLCVLCKKADESVHHLLISEIRIQQLKAQLKNMKMHGLTATEYLQRIRKVDALAGIEHLLSLNEHITAITDGVSEEYAMYISSIMTRSGAISLIEAEGLLLAHEDMSETESRDGSESSQLMS
ncbi:uncharacterized protein LOC130965835 [Arachis stenosperma]|uniref:uncharacterized protein LOC130965835 n=1 Tax=Arachis stenosperma TaxID=217475 RepID=UPI0025AB6290|nr:uncharacterized protein LOC130965835 [Arachis stenosperma]